MAIDRVRVTSTGWTGATGYTNFYFTNATTANLAAIGALLTSLRPYIPSVVTYTIPNGGDTVNEGDGKLSGSWSATAPGAVVGSATGIAATPVGFFVSWRSGTVVDAHRPTGKLFIVPAASSAFSTAGVVSASVVTAVNGFAATFLANTIGFVVWHRPKYNYDVKPPALVRNGLGVSVASATCSPKPAILRSRRD